MMKMWSDGTKKGWGIVYTIAFVIGGVLGWVIFK